MLLLSAQLSMKLLDQQREQANDEPAGGGLGGVRAAIAPGAQAVFLAALLADSPCNVRASFGGGSSRTLE